jgi:RNA polymerase sigma-70 factor (ECF subfamily)
MDLEATDEAIRPSEQSAEELSAWSRDIARRIAAGDKAAEAELATRFTPGLRLILRRATGGDAARVDDLLQESLIIVIRRLRRAPLEDATKLAAFAAQTARNLAIGHRRKTARQRTDTNTETLDRVTAPATDTPDQAEAESAQWVVRRILADLPQERDRVVLQRFYLLDHDRESICRDLGLSDNAFNQLMFRARTRLREILSQRGYDKSDLLTVLLMSLIASLSRGIVS